MNENALKLFHELMKKGWIDRRDNAAVWSLTQEAENMSDLEEIGKELGFDIINASDRIYLVPTQDNDLFLKNNMDFRKDIGPGGGDVRARDIYLMNYLAVYTLYEFFHGEGDNIEVRDFISKEDLIESFNKHTKEVTGKDTEEESEISDTFVTLSDNWLGKKEGDHDSKKIDERYGILNRLITKFKADELFTEENETLRPTRKLRDLMPYVLRRARVSEINDWISEKE